MEYLTSFIYQDKFCMSFHNLLMFAGHLEASKGINVLGKQLYIPQTERHPAFTLKIFSQARGNSDLFSFAIQFKTLEEREVVAACDFTDDIFYIER